ncbi:hypothetical protein DPMN_051308 [Dreissena polymorpha]|uniref:Uncharacterized protein n=1 Tax=Dreissena polymorpha TaxID=45954 RepID=A0A9D4CHM3_DREPO|nr:hypothetical protein DPMN_051308 [Dreissena polymorpha]
MHIEKTAPPPGGNIFQMITTIFKLAKNVTSRETNVLTKFHEDWAKNKTSLHGGYDFPPIMNIFELVRDIYKIDENDPSPPPGGHVILPIRTIFTLNRCIQKTNVLTKFHEDWTKNRKLPRPPPPGGHVFSPIWTIFELVRDTNETNVFTKNTAPPLGGHVFQRNGTIFELNQHIIKTNILTNFELSQGTIGTNALTKFHEDRTINVACRVFTRQNVDDERRTTHETTDKRRSQKLTMSTLCSGELTTSAIQPISVKSEGRKILWRKPTNQQTNQPTDQQTGQKQYVPHYYTCRSIHIILPGSNRIINFKDVTTPYMYKEVTTPYKEVSTLYTEETTPYAEEIII